MMKFIQDYMFSSDIWHITSWELGLRLLLATLLGGLIGLEREWNNHPAGFRTHILVCMGSTTIMLLSMYGFSSFVEEPNVRMDPARLAAQVVSGIGFLGAGAILRNGNVVTGLTTAASVWVVAAIGLCIGAGFYLASLFCTTLVWISLQLFNRWEKVWMKNRKVREIRIVMKNRPECLTEVITIFTAKQLWIDSIKMNTFAQERKQDSEPAELELAVKLKHVRQESRIVETFSQISSLDFVVSLEAKRFVVLKDNINNQDKVTL